MFAWWNLLPVVFMPILYVIFLKISKFNCLLVKIACSSTLMVSVGIYSLFLQQENLNGSLKDLQALNLSGTYQGKPSILPLSNAKPQEPTMYYSNDFFQSFLSCRASALNHWDGHDKNWNQAFLIALTRDPPIVFRYQGHL